MRIAIAASPSVAIPTLEHLIDGEHQLVSIFSQPDRAAGRGRILTPTPVSQWALDHNIPLHRPERAIELKDLLEGIDCVVTIGYGLLLPQEILDIPPYGFLNMHFSILPRWRGAAPVQRAIEAQDSLTGVTIFKLDAGMDTGPIYTIHRYALDSDITSDELLLELSEVGVGALDEALNAMSKGVKPVAQSNEGATRALKLSRDEGRIDWSQAAAVVSAKIRAFTSNPGAWTTFRGQVHKISAPRISELQLNPGEISVVGKRVHIGTGSVALEIGQITPSGKGLTDAAAWANGARLIAGERCE
jgi:methionyl-tRNA formyltransferase